MLVFFGWGLLLSLALLAAIGLRPDPHPSPIGLGLLLFVVARLALIYPGVGAWQVRRARPR